VKPKPVEPLEIKIEKKAPSESEIALRLSKMEAEYRALQETSQRIDWH